MALDISHRFCKKYLSEELLDKPQRPDEEAKDPVLQSTDVSRYVFHFNHWPLRILDLSMINAELTLRIGLSVSMSRSCVVNAIFFSAFEFTKKRINRLEVDENLLRAAST